MITYSKPTTDELAKASKDTEELKHTYIPKDSRHPNEWDSLCPEIKLSFLKTYPNQRSREIYFKRYLLRLKYSFKTKAGLNEWNSYSYYKQIGILTDRQAEKLLDDMEIRVAKGKSETRADDHKDIAQGIGYIGGGLCLGPWGIPLVIGGLITGTQPFRRRFLRARAYLYDLKED